MMDEIYTEKLGRFKEDENPEVILLIAVSSFREKAGDSPRRRRRNSPSTLNQGIETAAFVPNQISKHFSNRATTSLWGVSS